MEGGTWEIRQGDALERLREMPEGSVQCCVTSPPYWGLRDYGQDGQLGLEPTPEEYGANIVQVFREVRRVLRDDGTLWLNLGDSYHGSYIAQSRVDGRADTLNAANPAMAQKDTRRPAHGLKPKDLVGIPWMVAFALRADGWYLRSDIIWAKPNPMPESVTDRPTKAHEYLFLLTKSARYFYDADAVRESSAVVEQGRHAGPESNGYHIASGRNDSGAHKGGMGFGVDALGRNKRSVWTVATQPFPGAHFATFPPKLIEPCILAGSAEGDTVLDPFAGAATTGVIATRLDRSFLGIELSPEYVELGRDRIRDDAPLLNTPAEVAA